MTRLHNLRKASSQIVRREREVLSFVAIRVVIGWVLGLAGQHIFYIFERSWTIANRNPFTEWDAVHYLRIAYSGYDVHLTPFFPLYPLLVRFVHFGSLGLLGYEAAGIALGIVTLSGAAVVMRRFLSELLDEDSARFGVLLLLWSPASVFLLSNYNLSLLVLLLSLCSLALLRGNFMWSSVAASLAAVAHPLGLGGVVAVGVALIVNRRWKEFLPCICVSLSGLVAYCFYLTLKFSSPLVFQTQQHFYGKRFTLPFESVFHSLVAVFRDDLDPAGAAGMQFVFQFEMITALFGIAVLAYMLVSIVPWKGRQASLPLWLVGMTAYQIVVAATLTFVPVFHFPQADGGARIISLHVPVSYSRWFYLSLGFITIACLVTRAAPRLRVNFLLLSAAFAIFLQTMFVAALRYY